MGWRGGVLELHILKSATVCLPTVRLRRNWRLDYLSFNTERMMFAQSSCYLSQRDPFISVPRWIQNPVCRIERKKNDKATVCSSFHFLRLKVYCRVAHQGSQCAIVRCQSCSGHDRVLTMYTPACCALTFGLKTRRKGRERCTCCGKSILRLIGLLNSRYVGSIDEWQTQIWPALKMKRLSCWNVPWLVHQRVRPIDTSPCHVTFQMLELN